MRAGEVVGVAGVSGNGQQELMAALSGEDPRVPVGSVRLFGRDIARSPADSRRDAGMHFVPEERLGRGAVPTLSLAQNTLLTRTAAVRGGWISVAAHPPPGAAPDRVVQRQGQRHRGGGQEPVRRQPAEIHCRARDRRQSEVAHHQPADLGCRCGRGGANPRRDPQAARRRVRGAGGERGA